MMNFGSGQLRLLNRSLIAVQAVMVLAITWIGATGLLRRPQLPTSVRANRSPATQPAAKTAAKPLAWYAPIWARDLRQPPIEPRPTPLAADAARPPPPPPPLKVKLLGTVVEDQDRYGLFVDGNGRLVVRRLQEEIGEYTVVHIERGKAQIKGPGQPVWLTMPDYELRVGKD